MDQVHYYIEIDGWSAEKLTIDNLVKYKGEKIKYIKNNQSIEKAVLIQELAESIIEESRKCRNELLNAGVTGREINGRFKGNNINAKKLITDNKKIYLLYLLCGTMEKTANALGVSRQTVSEPINQYKQCMKDI